MAYALKYYGELGDYYDRIIRVEIYENNYLGSDSEMQLAGAQLTMTGDDENLFLDIVSTSVSVQVTSLTNFQYIDLYTGNKRKFQMIVKRDGVVIFKGWIVPDLYTEPYDTPPYPVTITARDGLVELETIDFDLVGIKTQSEILQTVLSQIVSDSNAIVYVGVNSFEENHITTESPLSQTWVNCERYSENTYSEVLSDLCYLYGARIYQREGEFWFVSNFEMKDSFFYTKYDNSGILGTGNYNNEILLGYDEEDKWVNVDQQLNILPAWKDIIVIKELGLRDSVLNNWDFSEWNGTINDWVESSAGLVEQYEIGDDLAAEFKANNNSPSDGNFITQTISNVTGSKHRVTFNIDFKIFDNIDTQGQFWVKIENWDGGSNYQYLTSNGTWSTTESFINFQNVEIKQELQAQTQNFDFGSGFTFPLSGSMFVSIYASDKGTLVVNEFKMEFRPFFTADYKQDLEVITPVGDNTFNPDETTILTGDLPDLQSIPNNPVLYGGALNEQHIYNGGMYLNSSRSAVTQKWSYLAIDYTFPLNLDKVIASQNAKLTVAPYWAITGTILEQNLWIDSTIVDKAITARKYLVCNGDLNLQDCQFNGTYIEIGASQVEADELNIVVNSSGLVQDDGIHDDTALWVD